MTATVKTKTGHEFTPDQAWEVFEELTTLLGSAEFPRVELRHDEDGWPEFWCPQCETTVGVHDVDLALRDSPLSLEVDDDQPGEYVSVCYDGNGDYHGLIYQCANCLKPVRLPEGMEIVTV